MFQVQGVDVDSAVMIRKHISRAKVHQIVCTAIKDRSKIGLLSSDCQVNPRCVALPQCRFRPLVLEVDLASPAAAHCHKLRVRRTRLQRRQV